MAVGVRHVVEISVASDRRKTTQGVLVRYPLVASPAGKFGPPNNLKRGRAPLDAELVQEVTYDTRVVVGVQAANGGDARQRAERQDAVIGGERVSEVPGRAVSQPDPAAGW
jgi:hypothetical protein